MKLGDYVVEKRPHAEHPLQPWVVRAGERVLRRYSRKSSAVRMARLLWADELELAALQAELERTPLNA